MRIKWQKHSAALFFCFEAKRVNAWSCITYMVKKQDGSNQEFIVVCHIHALKGLRKRILLQSRRDDKKNNKTFYGSVLRPRLFFCAMKIQEIIIERFITCKFFLDY